MAYDEGLAQRIREVLDGAEGVAEKKMFGGIAFLVHGNMSCGVVGDELMVRVGPDACEACLSLAHAREMDFTGKPMRGMLYVAEPGIEDDDDLVAWVERGASHARSLPPK